MNSAFDPTTLRQAFLTSLPEQTSQFDDRPPEARYLLIPENHARALSLDTAVVQGIRGSGKSLWWAALQSEPHRNRIAQVLGPRIMDSGTKVVAGFGTSPSPGDYPGLKVLSRLLKDYDADDIWTTIILQALSRVEGLPQRGPFFDSSIRWKEKVRWVVDNPEEVEEVFAEGEAELSKKQTSVLVVFDALDRTSTDARERHKLLRGLLMVLLELRSYRRIRAKAFVRPDMLEAPEVTSFPDASKIVTNDVNLVWSRSDLFGLLWQHLLNAPEGSILFRKLCRSKFDLRASSDTGVYRIKDRSLDESTARELFHTLSGPFMGTNRRRGFPYTWLPNHLADTRDQVSPRSFLAALRRAAEKTEEEAEYSITYQSIHTGVQRASEIRVKEVAEDFPWIYATIESLEGLVLPIRFSDVRKRWRRNEVLKKLADQEHQPPHLRDGEDGLRQDLEDLGFFGRLSDGRVNMPDVYRVGFRLKRRGGVRPIK